MKARRIIPLGAIVAAVAAVGLPVLAVDGRSGASTGDRYLPGSQRAGAGGGLSQAPDANCEQWRAGNPAQRANAVGDLEAAFARRLPGGRARGATLPRGEAVAIIDRACQETVAGPWRLWKIYEHALAFQYRSAAR